MCALQVAVKYLLCNTTLLSIVNHMELTEMVFTIQSPSSPAPLKLLGVGISHASNMILIKKSCRLSHDAGQSIEIIVWRF